MREPITDKRQMYAALAAGTLGNTLPQYFDRDSWYAGADTQRYKQWGIRSMLPGGPGAMYLSSFGAWRMMRDLTDRDVPFNVSPMIFGATLMANVCIGTTGLYVHYVEHPPEGVSWRELFATPGVSREAHGVAAYNLLSRHLNPNAYDDVTALLELYPDHVVEISATSDCVGLLPHRNYVTWEVRRY